MVVEAILQCKPGDETMIGVLLDQQGHPRGTKPTKAVIKKLQPVIVSALAATVHNNSLGMFWTLLQLAQNPEAADQIAGEARAKTAEVPFQLNTAPVALAAVREALRINPVLPFIERKAASDLVLEDIAIPKGTTVVFSPWFVQRNPEDSPDPIRYDIGRFAQGVRVDMTKWFPFGLGHRACIGNNLALNQMSYTISTICSAFTLSSRPLKIINHMI
jgi:cytochrome P450